MIDKISKALIFILLMLVCNPLFQKDDSKYVRDFQKVSQQYTWMDYNVYTIIKAKSEKYDLDRRFVYALIQNESGTYCGNDLQWMKTVVSWAGARGIMQVMPVHSKIPSKLFGIEYNIEKGASYLSRCIKKSKGNIREASRMYNGGLYNKRDEYRNWPYVDRIERSYMLAVNSYNIKL